MLGYESITVLFSLFVFLFLSKCHFKACYSIAEIFIQLIFSTSLAQDFRLLHSDTILEFSTTEMIFSDNLSYFPKICKLNSLNSHDQIFSLLSLKVNIILSLLYPLKCILKYN